MSILVVSNRPERFAFSASVEPIVRVAAGQRLRFDTSDDSYETLNGTDIDSGRVDFRRVNALSGPVFVEGARPGDALGFRVEEISVADRAHAVYVERWRRNHFGVSGSRVVRASLSAGMVKIESGRTFPIRPMIGCIGIAPARGSVSSLSPTARTGGNMDLIELCPGTTIWFPVEVQGGLLSLGDLHARMGRGEPLGSGLECRGSVTGTAIIAAGPRIAGPVVCDVRSIAFVGTSTVDWRDAETRAVRAAWNWLTSTGIDENDGLAICAALLDVENGGPAGNNVLAAFAIADLEAAGVAIDVWPLSSVPRGEIGQTLADDEPDAREQEREI